MKSYSITNPPHKAGIYLLRNKVSGLLYVGKTKDLHRRYTEWRVAFTQGLGVKSLRVQDVVADTKPSDWDFFIVMEFEEVSDHVLSEFEHQTIRRFEADAPGLLINTQLSAPMGDNIPGSRSTIIEAGVPISYSKAAKVLGCSTRQVQKRMARYRKKGVTVIDIEELKRLTAKFRYMPSEDDECTENAPSDHQTIED